jgi:hypothetical protein
MTPDDMEGRLLAVAEREGLNYIANLQGDIVWTRDLRALLLDYQERGRALEWIATTDFLPAKSASPWSTTENENDMGMGIVAIQERARATLKGKSHD